MNWKFDVVIGVKRSEALNAIYKFSKCKKYIFDAQYAAADDIADCCGHF